MDLVLSCVSLCYFMHTCDFTFLNLAVDVDICAHSIANIV